MAEDEQPKWRGGIKTIIQGQIDKAWAICGNFCALDKWINTVDECIKVEGEYQQPGCVRYMTGSTFKPAGGGKAWAKEKLLTFDEDNHTYSYQMIANNFALGQQYVATFKLQDLGDGATLVEWSFVSPPVENLEEEQLVASMTSTYTRSVKILEELVSAEESISQPPGNLVS